AGGLLTHAASLTFDGETLNDLVCQNVETIAFLPTERFPEHVVAAAYGVFGIILARNEGPEVSRGWTPGALGRALSHEAAHIKYFRVNFEGYPHRLNYLGPNERSAYAVDKGFLTAYLAREPVSDSEKWLKDSLIIDQDAVTLANRRLGIPEG